MALYEFDFTGAPPAQGSLGSDVIPAGRYRLQIEEIKDGTTKNGDKKMVSVKCVVAQGEMKGKVLRDNFVYTGDNNFGMRRLHAFFLACNLGVSERRVKVDFDKIPGRLVDADVKDDTIPANEQYDARPSSRIDAYYSTKVAEAPAAATPAVNGAQAAVAQKAAPKAAPVAAPAAVAVAEPEADVVDDSEVVDDASEPAVDIAEATDDLFS